VEGDGREEEEYWEGREDLKRKNRRGREEESIV